MFNDEMNLEGNPDYCEATHSYDIRTSVWPSTVLSNFAANTFELDGVLCASMEGFLQSLKVQDVDKQAEICSLVGGRAMRAGRRHDWKSSQLLYWRGQVYGRHTVEYQALITRAYQACYEQCAEFRAALAATVGLRLAHSLGKSDPSQTVLTEIEFTERLTRLRDCGTL